MPATLYPNAQNKFCRIFLIVALLALIAFGTNSKSPPRIVISAASIATSAPVPIAIPISAFTSAGASLIPSPTMATCLPLSCNKEI